MINRRKSRPSLSIMARLHFRRPIGEVGGETPFPFVRLKSGGPPNLLHDGIRPVDRRKPQQQVKS
jgi:hypothetical protein